MATPATALLLLAPLANDLLFSEEAKLVPAQVALQDDYGVAVAIDGDRLAAGALEDQQTPDTGRIYVWQHDGTAWNETAQLVPAGAPTGLMFGQLLDLDGDVVVGLSQTALQGSPSLGVFEFDGAAWNEAASMVPSINGVTSIALDGDTLLAGFPALGGNVGTVNVYTRQGTSWSSWTETSISASDGVNGDRFGAAVAVDGDLMAVGAWGSDASPALTDAGSVYVLRRAAGVWTEEARLFGTAPDFNDRLGSSVAIGGGVVAAGAPFDTLPPGFHEGAVETWQDAGGVWTPIAKLRSSTLLQDEEFGAALALENGRLAVGAPTSGSGGDRGAAWLFTLNAGAWTQQKKVIPSDATSGMRFGNSVGVSGDRVAAGAPGDQLPAGNQSGSAYVLRFDGPPALVYCTAKPTSDGCVPSISWTGTATLTGADDLVVTADQVAPGKTGLFFYGTNGPAALPFLGGTLCVQPGLTRTLPQAATGSGLCGGAYAFAFTQARLAAEGVGPGGSIHGQWWLRDPQNPDGTGVSLSDGIELVVGS